MNFVPAHWHVAWQQPAIDVTQLLHGSQRCFKIQPTKARAIARFALNTHRIMDLESEHLQAAADPHDFATVAQVTGQNHMAPSH